MSLQYVIDGYNIIHHPLFIQHTNKKISPVRNTKALREENKISNGVKDSRISLLEFIRVNKLCKSPKNKITVVFDGHPNLASQRLDKTDIEVIFSRAQTADERIKKIIEATENPKNMVVVSSDKEIKFFARAYGAKSLSIEEFINYKKGLRKKEEDLSESELSYSQMHKINQELRKIWLK